MKFEMSGEKFAEGSKEMYNNLVYGTFKKNNKRFKILCIIAIVATILCGILDAKERTLMFTFAGIIILCMILSSLGPYYKKRTDKKLENNNLEKIIYDINEEYIEVDAYLKEGSENKVHYDIKNITKIIVTNNFYFVYINKYNALVIDKNSIDDEKAFFDILRNPKIEEKLV